MPGPAFLPRPQACARPDASKTRCTRVAPLMTSERLRRGRKVTVGARRRRLLTAVGRPSSGAVVIAPRLPLSRQMQPDVRESPPLGAVGERHPRAAVACSGSPQGLGVHESPRSAASLICCMGLTPSTLKPGVAGEFF